MKKDDNLFVDVIFKKENIADAREAFRKRARHYHDVQYRYTRYWKMPGTKVLSVRGDEDIILDIAKQYEALDFYVLA